MILNTKDMYDMAKEMLLSQKQIKFLDIYVRNNQHMGNTVREIGITIQAGHTYLKCKAILLCLKILELKDDSMAEAEFTPSIEWITNQWTKLYKMALEKEDDKEARAILGKIMDLKKVFGDLMVTEKDGVVKMSQEQLVKYIDSLTTDIKAHIKKDKWFEKKEVA